MSVRHHYSPPVKAEWLANQSFDKVMAKLPILLIALTLSLSLLVGCGGSEVGPDSTFAVIGSPTPVSGEVPSAPPLPTPDISSSAPLGPSDEPATEPTLLAFPLPAGSRPHDVAPAKCWGASASSQRGHRLVSSGDVRYLISASSPWVRKRGSVCVSLHPERHSRAGACGEPDCKPGMADVDFLTPGGCAEKLVLGVGAALNHHCPGIDLAHVDERQRGLVAGHSFHQSTDVGRNPGPASLGIEVSQPAVQR
jgi:hypothetical protein